MKNNKHNNYVRRIATLQVAALLAAGVLGHQTLGAQSVATSTDLFFYNANQQSAASGHVVNSTAGFTTQKSYGPGSFAPWTHFVGSSYDILCYDAATGNALLGELDGSGNFTTAYPLGRIFSSGWTHIVEHKGYLFFYNASNGVGAVGAFQFGVFHQYNTWYNFSTGWTSIVSTPNGLLFYNAADGSGAVGDWNVTVVGPGFGTVSKVDFVQSASYAPGSFTYGWTHIVNTNNGVLFYNSTTGLEGMADLWPGGSITTRTRTVSTIRAGWTSIVFDGVNLVFYDALTGDVEIGGISTSDLINPGGLLFRRSLPGYFSTGWTNIIPATVITPIK